MSRKIKGVAIPEIAEVPFVERGACADINRACAKFFRERNPQPELTEEQRRAAVRAKFAPGR